MQLSVVIGLEIHAQIATTTKMFCTCANATFGALPNTQICPVCTGQPGALPVVNQAAVKLGLKTALALDCEILPRMKFDRKNYFYPDLPMGFQISQYDEPLAQKGQLRIKLANHQKKIGITRLHLENDAGKLTHTGEYSFLDFNRAGTPLMEIVTEPDLSSAFEAKIFAEEMQKILQFVGSSQAEMSRGEMRFDASVSLRTPNSTKLNPRAEIKNLNSFRALETALKFEIARQQKLWEDSNPPIRDSTRGFDDTLNQTYLLREKESAADYRYFPEPDLPSLTFSADTIAAVRAALPELPAVRQKRFQQEFPQLKPEDIFELTKTTEIADYFEAVVQVSADPGHSAAWILSELLGCFKADSAKFQATKIKAQHLGALIKMISSGEISGKIGKTIFAELWQKDQDPRQILEQCGLKQISDPAEITKIIEQVLAENPQAVANFQDGKQAAFGFLIGQVMKISRGQANPKLTNQLLRAKLQ